ncbi:DNA polymerase II [Kistimonas scapharcae]|uniref:DNA polymerase n=1 Tax=Kistimonas scapharcae TaxID=1036133 RepID=A0ABP8V5E5_9GAMM
MTTGSGIAKLIVTGERPVFFVMDEDYIRLSACLSKAGLTHECRAVALETFHHEPVRAVYTPTLEVGFKAQDRLRKLGVTLFEADIRLHERYLMERFITGGIAFTGWAVRQRGYTEYHDVKVRPAEVSSPFSVLSLDVECSMDGELYSVGLAGETVERVLMIGSPVFGHSPGLSEGTILWVENERSLLKALEEEIEQLDPDILIGWNVVNFDCRLLLERARVHGFRLCLGRGKQPASWRERRGESGVGFVTVPGRVVIDGIDALKSATYQFADFTLETVSQSLLGRGKATEEVDNRLAAITHDFHHDKHKLARYNLEDCRLVLDIFCQTRLLDFLRLRSQLTGLELDRMGGSVAAFTHLYLPRLHRAGYVAPNLPDDGGLASPGGYVMDSKPGLYNNVLVLDFKSLYPSIIRTFKIDPLGLVEGLKQPEQAIPGYRGAVFSRQSHFLPAIITSLWQQRDEAKQQQDSARSQAIKILMNSFYGVLGSGGCRFYDTRLASSITLRGHAIMQQTAGWIEAEGYQVIYGDTDSLFVRLADHFSPEEAGCIGKALVMDINQRWHDALQEEFQLDSYLELEFETHYIRFLMPTIRGAETGSKKRYAGLKWTSAGEQLVFKGLESVRSDWTPLARQFQVQLFERVFADQSPADLVKETVRQTLAGERDSELVYRKRLRRPLSQYVRSSPPHVRAARQADECNRAAGKMLRYQNKGWISYIITVNGPEAVEHRVSPIDYQHYIDKQLKPVAEVVLPFAGEGFAQLWDEQLSLF